MSRNGFFRFGGLYFSTSLTLSISTVTSVPRLIVALPPSPAKGVGKVRLKTLADLDRRTLAARAVFERRSAFASDLGGDDQLSAMQKELVDSAAMLGAMREDAAASWLSGEPTDLMEFQALVKAQRQIIADLGLKRVARDITDHLDAYRRTA